MTTPLVSLMVLSWNGIEHLKTCLPSVCAQTIRDREIVLMDNGSTDGTETWVRTHFPEVRVERVEQNLGVPGGVNHGISSTRGRYVAILTNDIELEPHWLAESLAALETFPEVGFTASRVRLYYQRDRLDTVGDMYFREGYPAKRGWLSVDGPEFDESVPVFGACAVAALYRREMLEEVGLMDVDFEAGLEDLDLSFRAQLYGYGCRYVPGAVLYHKLGATVGQGLVKPEHRLRMHRNLWMLRIKNLPWQLWLRYLPHMLLAELVVLYRGLRSGHGRVLLRARVEVVRHLRSTLAKRRSIQVHRRISIAELDKRISRGWFAQRLREKTLEASPADDS